MLNRIIHFALHNRLLILLASILVMAAGIYTASRTEVDVFPDLNAPTVVVMTEANGMAAEEVEQLVMRHEEIVGIHDLIVHDYGPGRLMISLHAEVSARSDILVIHDEIDNVEKELQEKLGCHAVIHMDPIVVDDVVTNEAKQKIATLIHCIDDEIHIHDFRMVVGNNHVYLIPGSILGETSMSYLGLGMKAPATSWGVLLKETEDLVSVAQCPWKMIPLVFVIITVLAFNFLGDGLRDAFDPKMKR